MGVLVISKSFIVREALEIFIINNFKNYNFNSVSTLDESKNIDLSKTKLIIIDIENDMIDKINDIIKVNESIKILVLDKISNINILKKCIKFGIEGYLSDISEKEELVYIINQIIKGKKYYDPSIIKDILFDNIYDNDIDMLTTRENEIFNLVVDGLTNKDIAKELYITEHTIKKHIRNILFKLDMRNRKELIIYGKTNYNI